MFVSFGVNKLSCDNMMGCGKKTEEFRVSERDILEVGGEGKMYVWITGPWNGYFRFSFLIFSSVHYK